MALMTPEELAVYLRVTKKTIYRLLEKGHIPAIKVGRQWRFDKVDIDSWLSESSKKDEVSILVIDDEKEIVVGNVYKLHGANSFEVIRRIYDRIEQINKTLPPGVTVNIIDAIDETLKITPLSFFCIGFRAACIKRAVAPQ